MGRFCTQCKSSTRCFGMT
ncbi:hypothetical protein LINPERPRIM_LOCUS33359 [Linum perenne]